MVLVDIKDERLAVAESLGATATINAKSDVLAEIVNRNLGPIDVTIECSGAQIAIVNSIKVSSILILEKLKLQNRDLFLQSLEKNSL